ncbi:MAG: hypothetical protein JWR52_1786 [Marmoricola sp.]|nr:hypothetical protein [Marmoricola sp.]
MRRFVLLLTTALLCASGVVGPAAADVATVGPPGVYLVGNRGNIFTTRIQVQLRLDPGEVNIPNAQGPEDLSWDLEVQSVGMRAPAPPSWTTPITNTTVRYHTLAIGSGRILCARARQHSWGVTSGWSKVMCVERARDDQSLRRTGPVHIVADWRYPDGHASVLLPTTRIRVSQIPAGAWYGPVYTDRGIRPDGTVCTHPTWHIVGHREPNRAYGFINNGITLMMHRTRAPGTAILRSPFGHTCPAGSSSCRRGCRANPHEDLPMTQHNECPLE